ncbi:hypothetical protein NC653_005331 [Populus alba x Populus x berolinensis]|uniref:Secreted protein n=1 Tax=Populus alba x Populus x berolinensis TaxID=444605 RepID=A0AAD6RBQ1_9ROSI|nr:hypothetical protein NC653_005331 [Populus alba x Populus x berolinensis]
MPITLMPWSQLRLSLLACITSWQISNYNKLDATIYCIKSVQLMKATRAPHFNPFKNLTSCRLKGTYMFWLFLPRLIPWSRGVTVYV